MPVKAPGSPKSTTLRPAKTSPARHRRDPLAALLQERRLRQPVARLDRHRSPSHPGCRNGPATYRRTGREANGEAGGMDPKAARIVVVGAGQAGASLVAKLRALGHAGPLTLVGAEPYLPYQRPPLSKGYLKGEMALERLFLRPRSFFEAEGITLLTGTPATAIDRAARTLALADGRTPCLGPPRAHHRQHPPPPAGRDRRRPRRRPADAGAGRRRRAGRHPRRPQPRAHRRRRLHRPRGRRRPAREGPRGHAHRGRPAHPRPRRGPRHRRLFPRPPRPPRRRPSAKAPPSPA